MITPAIAQDRLYYIYTRVSTEEQAASGHSLASQEQSCQAMCLARGLKVGGVITDSGESAKNLVRPEVQRLISLVRESKVAGVVIWRLDRLTRNLRDLLDLVSMFDETDTSLVSVCEQIDTKTPGGRMMLSILGSVAQWERESIAERILTGVRHRKAAGGWIGGPIPAGCRVVGESGKKTLEIDPTTAPVVARIWDLVASGATLRDVALYLTDHGITPPRKMGWRFSTVQNLMRQRRLIGLLVDEATFDKAHKALGQRSCPQRPSGPIRLAGNHSSDRIWPLSNLARCASCGAAMFGCCGTGRSGKLYHYLRCHNKAKGACKAKELPAESWEAAVSKAVCMTIDREGPLCRRMNELAEDLRAKEHARKSELDALAKTRDGMRKRIGRLIELVELGEAPGKGVSVRLAELEKDLIRVESQMAELEGLNAAAGMNALGVESMVETLRESVQGLDARSKEEQHRVLHSLLAEVVLGDNKPIKLVFWMPELPSAVQTAERSKLKTDNKEPVPAGVFPSGHGFACRSQMVEAPGIEPGSGCVRTMLLHA